MTSRHWIVALGGALLLALAACADVEDTGDGLAGDAGGADDVADAAADEPDDDDAGGDADDDGNGDSDDDAGDDDTGDDAAADGDFPSGSIDYILPFDPGGESDITARAQQQGLEEELGQSVVIDYMEGGGGALGWSELTRTDPDGYTLMGHNIPHIIIQPLTRDDAGYQTEDLKQVYTFQNTPMAFVVAADSEWETLDDFIAAAEEAPGGLTVGGSGEFTANHVSTLRLMSEAGIEVTYVPFSGTGAAVPALLGGHVTALMTNTPPAVEQPDEMRALAVSTEERFEPLADVPTFLEEDIDLVEGTYRGVSVQADTPDEVVDTLADAFAAVNSDPDFVEEMENLGFEMLDLGPEESAEVTAERTEVYEELIEEFGLADG